MFNTGPRRRGLLDRGYLPTDNCICAGLFKYMSTAVLCNTGQKRLSVLLESMVADPRSFLGRYHVVAMESPLFLKQTSGIDKANLPHECRSMKDPPV